ncbi:HAD family hydrolase [Paenibacillus sp. CF384]|uniref:HAD family hydrolase n=1 Tax=Paenibacillus sp. CF384 TaxID=1884382 RepID=UPI00089A745B|nr:HAD family hydrolase [Paenibacillus sp. CF384]SDW71821.1 FMN phosphatase YigB, HAD superfamily [Paenibacillus sp. CF384]
MHNENWLSGIKVVIFDMDGTLYQEDTYLDRYIRYLLEGTAHEGETDAAIQLGRAIRAGEHAIQFGHFYHKRDDVWLVREGTSFVRGNTWEGTKVADEQALGYGTVSAQVQHLVPIGDPWGIAAALNHRYKLPEQNLKAAFDRVRKEMVEEARYQFFCHTDLFRAIQELTAVEIKALMTNTHHISGIEFTSYMGIRHLFEEVVYDANKPNGLHLYMKTLLEQGYQAHEILSIGDNPWNDLHPVKQLGGRTCLISPYPSSDREVWDLRLHHLDELEQLMRTIQQSITRRNMADGEDRIEADRQEVQG